MFAWKRLISWLSRSAPQEPPCLPVFWTLQSVYLARAYFVVAELGIADLLYERPRTAAELAQTTGVHEPSLYRILRALAGFDVFAENEQGQFALTERGHSLREDVLGTVRHWTLLTGSLPAWTSLGQALDVVRTGRSGFQLAHGEAGDLYRFCEHDTAFGRTFIRAMNNWTDWQREAILARYDFRPFPSVVDVGGGRGSLICGILGQSPQTRGMLYDRPQSIEQARAVITAAGLGERCDLVPGNFLESIPAGGDVYVLKHILRDWDDELSATILRNCYHAMSASSRLLIIDAVLDPRNSKDRIGKLLDLEQMFWLNGTLRTLDQWQALLTKTGFRISELRRTQVVDAVILQLEKKSASCGGSSPE